MVAPLNADPPSEVILNRLPGFVLDAATKLESGTSNLPLATVVSAPDWPRALGAVKLNVPAISVLVSLVITMVPAAPSRSVFQLLKLPLVDTLTVAPPPAVVSWFTPRG